MATIKHTLELTTGEEVAVIGLCSHEHEHRICWSLNRVLNTDMGRREMDVMQQEHAFAAFDSSANGTGYSFSLISNRCGGEKLISEVPHADHFLVLHGEENIEHVEQTLERVRSSDQVLAAFELDITKMKMGNKLLG